MPIATKDSITITFDTINPNLSTILMVDYYTIGELTWRINIIGIIVAIIIYCISLIFSYGCDLQKESDETLLSYLKTYIKRLTNSQLL